MSNKLLKELEEAMVWAFENKKMELFKVLEEFFEQADEDYEEENSSEEEDSPLIGTVVSEEIEVVTDKNGFLSLA
jgi:hypothetical protein